MVEPTWMTIAKSYLGLQEAPGTADNPAVVELYALAGFPNVKHDSVPWCAAYVGGVLVKAHLKSSGSLMAMSYSTWGKPMSGPGYGCIGVKRRKGGATLGHVGFVVGATADEIILLGGNQNDRVSYAAFPRFDFVAFRWPSGLAVPSNLPPLATSVAGAIRGVTES